MKTDGTKRLRDLDEENQRPKAHHGRQGNRDRRSPGDLSAYFSARRRYAGRSRCFVTAGLFAAGLSDRRLVPLHPAPPRRAGRSRPGAARRVSRLRHGSSALGLSAAHVVLRTEGHHELNQEKIQRLRREERLRVPHPAMREAPPRGFDHPNRPPGRCLPRRRLGSRLPVRRHHHREDHQGSARHRRVHEEVPLCPRRTLHRRGRRYGRLG